MILRPYQAAAVDRLRQGIREGRRRQILCAPTGSGKTVMAIDLVRRAAQRGSRVYFICDRQALVRQTSDRFHEFGVEHGVLMAGESVRTWSAVMVTSAQTLERRGFRWSEQGAPFESERQLPAPDLVIVDECHDQRRATLAAIVEHGCVAVGLSATPLAKGLADHWQSVENVATTNQLIREQWLVPLRVYAPETRIDTHGLRARSGGEWSEADVSDRVLRIVGEIVPEWTRRCQAEFGGPVPTLAFLPSVVDCDATMQAFQEAGHDFRAVHYRMPDAARRDAIEGFRQGRHTGLVSCVALTKGFDVPSAQVLIDAYPHRKSLTMILQKYGRVMRTAEGKTHGVVIDHAGNYTGFHDAIHGVYEQGVGELESNLAGTVRRKGEPPRSAACRGCGYVWPPATREMPRPSHCPVCGAAAPRPRGRLERLSGDLAHAGDIDGRSRFDGLDVWAELCRHASGITDDDERARRIALASHRGLLGRWPPRGSEFQRDDEPAHPLVASAARRSYQAWRRRQAA